MSKSSVLALVIAAFLLGMWAADSIRSAVSAPAPAAAPAAPAPAAQKPPMFQEVVVPDKNGEQGAVYMIYHGPGQICTPSQWVVPLKQSAEKPAAEQPGVEKPKVSEKPAVEKPTTLEKPAVEKPKLPEKPAAEKSKTPAKAPPQ
jgi:hypothetical protein